ELGYGSDLDIVFVHDSDGEDQNTDGENSLDNAVFFGRLARRLIHILTMPTTTGSLYEVDTRLRPSGNSGLLVTSLKAFDRYQREDAWTWEHQALLRSRPVAGSTDIRDAYERLRISALQNYVRKDKLRQDVLDMRERMRKELSKGDAEHFYIKPDRGGITDIEFLVQFLVLSHVHEDASLAEFSDNIRQLDALVAAGVLEATQAESLADAYRQYRVLLHRLSLAGEKGVVRRQDCKPYIEVVETAWRQFLDQPD
ncbi:MAG: bifunctional [glutamate--ammonia ligase]-adenylyl-L-tyrosine phosphorylase/[glutamate--ammonia-ligase] adenylyltransferase, partial [Gammaproteobacteria bacterium]